MTVNIILECAELGTGEGPEEGVIYSRHLLLIQMKTF